MATYSDYINQALRLAGILSEGQSASAEMGADSLVVFNDLMGTLEAESIDVGYVPSGSTTATLSLNEGDRESVKHLLASRLAAHFGVPLSEVVAMVAQSGYLRMQRIGVLRGLIPTRAPVPRGDAQNVENILTGQ